MLLYQTVSHRTDMYLNDVSSQTADMINALIQNNFNEAHNINTAIQNKNEEEAIDYYNKIRKTSNFNFFRLFSSIEEANQWIQNRYNTSYSIKSISNTDFYLMPIQEESCALFWDFTYAKNPFLAICENHKLETILKKNVFNNQGISFPISEDGNIIIANKKMNFYDILKDKFNISNNELLTIRKDIDEGYTANHLISSNSNNEYYLSFQKLQFSNWRLVIFVPAQALGINTESYSIGNIIITLTCSLLFILLIFYIICSNRQSNKQIRKIAYIDPVTNGYNKNYLLNHMDSFHNINSIMSLDICEFKTINNAYGIEVGNQVLTQLYQAISSSIIKDDFVIRDTADVFIILSSAKDRSEIQTRYDMILSEIARLTNINQFDFAINLQCGATFISDCTDFKILIEQANSARKSNGNALNVLRFYDNKMLEQKIRENTLLADLDQAIENKDLHLFLQPKFNLKTNAICGAEALVRWIHPDLGMISPAEFIPLFEKKHVISKIDYFIFEEVCRFIQDRQKRNLDVIKISINVSKQNITNCNFLDDYRNIADRYHVNPEYLELELTETTFIENVKDISKFVENIHNHGFQCSLDDFGSGYSSLGMLSEIDIDALKLDRSFFNKNITKKVIATISAIISLAESLEIEVIAEGIETEEMIQILQSINCTIIQGYYFYKPMPADDFSNIFKTHDQ